MSKTTPKPRKRSNPVAKNLNKFNRAKVVPAKKGRGTVYKRSKDRPMLYQ